jgi:hypothetical protein
MSFMQTVMKHHTNTVRQRHALERGASHQQSPKSQIIYPKTP